jgi:hypothetical protein
MLRCKHFENVYVGMLPCVIQYIILSETYLAVRSALFYNITQRIVAFTDVSLQPIASHSLGSGLTCCHEMSSRYYHSTLRNTPEERGSQLHRDGSL